MCRRLADLVARLPEIKANPVRMLSPSAFRKTMRTTKPPTSSAFDVVKFKAQIDDLEGDDLYLGVTALYLGAQAMGFRKIQDDDPLPDLSARTASLMAVAMLNREFHVTEGRLLQRMKRTQKKGGVSMEHLSHVPIGNADENFNVDAGSVMDAATDVANLWLREAVKSAAKDDLKKGTAEIARKHMWRYSIRFGQNGLWTRAAWEAWRTDVAGKNQMVFTPEDPDFALLMDAWVARHEASSMEFAHIDIHTWPERSKESRRAAQLDKTVTSIVRKPGRKRRIVVGRPKDTTKIVPGYVVRKAIFERSYIAMFLDQPLPKFPGMTIMKLLEPWCVIDDLADLLPTSKAEPMLESLAAVERAALCVTKAELVDVLKRALGYDAATAEAVIQFLTWTPNVYKGLWGAPLIPIPGEDRFALARGVLATTNFVRLAEIWFTRGGFDGNSPRVREGMSMRSFCAKKLQMN